MTLLLLSNNIRAMDKKQTNAAQKNTVTTLRFVRARLVERGDSLNAWSLRNGFLPMHVTRSLRGDYRGPKAQMVLDGIRNHLGL